MRASLLTGPAVATSAVGITEPQILAALLTIEGLLFAALSISVSLTAGSTFGRRTPISPRWLAVSAVLVLVVVAAGATLSWSQLFCGANWPHSLWGQLEALALLVAICAPPLLAVLITVGVWES